jgi:hypothetical protein
MYVSARYLRKYVAQNALRGVDRLKIALEKVVENIILFSP